MTVAELLAAFEGEDGDAEIFVIVNDEPVLYELRDSGIHEGKQVIYAYEPES